MNVASDLPEDSYAFCHAVAKRSRSNFQPCFWLLPRAKRRAMDALYAFMRHTDDLGDSSDAVAARREQLRRWRESLDGVLRGKTPDTQSDAAQRILPAVAETVRRFHIPPEHLHAAIDGVEMDLEPRRYETFDELIEYCRRVASAVGLACIHIWGFDGPAAIEPAVRCGLALQLTNILRDLKEDADMGRVYLPMEDFRQCGYSVEELQCGEVNPGLRRLVALEIDRAKRLYHDGCDLIDRLEPDGRRIFGMMMSVYYRLLGRIERADGEILRRRMRLNRREKLVIAARWLLLPPRRAALP
jgi:15-cis-phytoene synthase